MLDKYTVSAKLQARIHAKIQACMDAANSHFKLMFKLPFPDISYDCRGTNGGYAIPEANALHFNPILLNENVEDYVESTVPHEVAHIVDFMVHGHQYRGGYSRYGRRKRDVHGATWKFIMRLFGADPSRCHNYDTENAQVKVKKKFLYVCPTCRQDFIFGPVRHKKALRGAKYYCGKCGQGAPAIVLKTRLGQVTYKEARVKVNKLQTKSVGISGGTKKDRVAQLVRDHSNTLSRGALINKIMTEIGMTQAGATTYLYNVMKEMKV